jgi:hypothetical protein
MKLIFEIDQPIKAASHHIQRKAKISANVLNARQISNLLSTNISRQL